MVSGVAAVLTVGSRAAQWAEITRIAFGRGSSAPSCAHAATVALAAHTVGLAIALGVWGIANTALYPVCQIRVMKAAPQAQALAGTLNVSAANGGIALGALLGGASIDAWGVQSVAVVGAGIAVVAAVAATAISRRLKSRASQAESALVFREP